MTYPEFTAAVQVLAWSWKVSVTSWWRSQDRNRKVGGRPNSKHLWGGAADLVPDSDRDIPDIVRAAREAGLIAALETDHIHVEAP